ncbi:MAG: hypothetical protein QOJ92_308 [Frankiales bacterium]|jgi:hypothetical protein|nr:hypothetical protein [Frankiales bacterium]MDX6273098.1 hypothetical protein [Frankiales bacterium]
MRVKSMLPVTTGLVGAVAAAVVVSWAAPGTAADNYPADKMTVSGSSMESTGPNTEKVILSATMRTSTTEDLVLNVTAECDIQTSLANAGASDSSAFGQAKIYITVDNVVVKVSPDDPDGRVVFCNRAHQASSTFTNPADSYNSFLQTRQANAFNWVALNVGNGIHKINVIARYDTSTSGDATAKAVIGKRSLVVEPTKAARNETTASN